MIFLIVALNVGNRSMITGFYNSETDKIISSSSINKKMTGDDFIILLKKTIDLYDIKTKPEGFVVSSVVPAVTSNIVEAIRRFYSTEPLVVGPGLKTGLNIKINDPSQLGSDLVCMATAAIDKYPMPAVIIYMGDTTTLSYIDKNSFYCGTVIVTGVNSLLDSLVDNADLLTSVPLTAPEKVIGTDTSKSIRSGIIFGSAAFIDGITDRIAEERGDISTIVATGNFAESVIPYCKKSIFTDKTLLTDGLYKLYMKNTLTKSFN